jgi:hypothetical protein
MSLTSYRAAPPRGQVYIMEWLEGLCKRFPRKTRNSLYSLVGTRSRGPDQGEALPGIGAAGKPHLMSGCFCVKLRYQR